MIRLCDNNDVETIYQIINDSAQAYKGVIMDDTFHEPYMSLEELAREIGDGVIFWGFENESNELIGIMGIQDKVGMKNGFRVVSPEEKDILLRRYWNVSERQIETSVVLCDQRYVMNL